MQKELTCIWYCGKCWGQLLSLSSSKLKKELYEETVILYLPSDMIPWWGKKSL